jgi:hypothetical protein
VKTYKTKTNTVELLQNNSIDAHQTQKEHNRNSEHHKTKKHMLTVNAPLLTKRQIHTDTQTHACEVLKNTKSNQETII